MITLNLKLSKQLCFYCLVSQTWNSSLDSIMNWEQGVNSMNFCWWRMNTPTMDHGPEHAPHHDMDQVAGVVIWAHDQVQTGRKNLLCFERHCKNGWGSKVSAWCAEAAIRAEHKVASLRLAKSVIDFPLLSYATKLNDIVLLAANVAVVNNVDQSRELNGNRTAAGLHLWQGTLKFW